jgi:ABC-type antimicrobial peptide transport system permease subunit
VDGQLLERSASFKLRTTVPLTGAAADPNLTPEFPGVTDKLDIRHWDPPFPFENKRVGPRDEHYWDEYRTTPKAYITLPAAQKLWGSRFGKLTSIRIAPPSGSELTEAAKTFRQVLLRQLQPERGGFIFEPVRERALAASQGGTDFSGLFLGFSFFLIGSALLLVALLVRLNMEHRASEIGLLLATGYRRSKIRKLLLGEGAAVALVGAIVGILGALIYAQLLLGMFRTWWPGGLQPSSLKLHPLESGGTSLIIGAAAGWLMSLLAILWGLWSLTRLTPSALLAGATTPIETSASVGKSRLSWIMVWTALLGGILAGIGGHYSQEAELKATGFFTSGLLLLTAQVTLFAIWMRATRYVSMPVHGTSALARLGIRNATRHRLRSLLTTGLLAAAIFLLIAVESFHRDPETDSPGREGGAGGFLLVGESAVPIFQDLNTPEGREELGIQSADEPAFQGVSFYSLRATQGDDVSCLNLYQPHRPRLLGVPPQLIRRGGFAFSAAESKTPSERQNPWELLETETGFEIPAFADATTAEWVLHVKLGDTLPFEDSRGRQHGLRLVGLLADSIFQGQLLVSEANFLKLYPDQEGYRYFLIAAPPERGSNIRRVLETRLADRGFEVTTTARRLESYMAVENMYLATFQALGAFGLLLGACGMAVVLLRSVWERRAELALLRALGFRRSALRWLIFTETGFLLILGVAIGTLAALAAVTPHLLAGSSEMPWLRLCILVGAVLVTGLAATAVATRSSLQASLIPALRKE